MPDNGDISDEKKSKKRSAAKVAANARWNKKARENGVYKQFNVTVPPNVIDDISYYCNNNNISKAEFLRRIAAKIEAGTFEI